MAELARGGPVNPNNTFVFVHKCDYVIPKSLIDHWKGLLDGINEGLDKPDDN